MLNHVFDKLIDGLSAVEEREEGVAFFKVAKSVYLNISTIEYISVNIPIATRKNQYLHCAYSDTRVRQAVSTKPLDNARLSESGMPSLKFRNGSHGPEVGSTAPAEGPQELVLPLRPLRSEVAAIAIRGDVPCDVPGSDGARIPPEFLILANYFHQHIMRIYGHDSTREMIMTARELDCLKWVAEGKTAWEVSVILGISERTVRFHLNSAREKMRCSTTTQAVAKAVAQSLIPI